MIPQTMTVAKNVKGKRSSCLFGDKNRQDEFQKNGSSLLSGDLIDRFKKLNSEKGL